MGARFYFLWSLHNMNHGIKTFYLAKKALPFS